MKKLIGAQLVNVREFCKDAEGLDSSLKKISDIGYKIIQVSGIGPIPADIIKKTADKYGLKTVVSHRRFSEFQENIDEIIEYNKILGCEVAGIGMMPRESMENLDNLKKFISQTNDMCVKLKENGLYFGYHNHPFEFQRFDKKYIMDYLIEETDPDIFRFILDTYWVAYSGVNIAKLIRRLGKRAHIVHFKDLKIIKGESTFAEVMEGNLDWEEIISACEDAGTKWAVVEQDECQGDPFDSLKISYDNLCRRGFC